MGCLSHAAYAYFFTVRPLIFSVPVYFPGRLCPVVFIFVAHAFFLSVLFLSVDRTSDCTVPRAVMSVSWCLGVPRGASEPWHRRRGAAGA